MLRDVHRRTARCGLGIWTMKWNWTGRLSKACRNITRDQSGNVLMITAAAIIPLLGMIGSGIDISRAYMAQLRLQQACDAGALAGRRYMAAGQWSDASEKEADKMFQFNFPDNLYGSKNVNFTAEALSSADVAGNATAYLPTLIMHMWPFGKQGFNLSANCTAKLEIANTDVMLVLDVTGSMVTASGSGTRMSALKESAMVFFDTIAAAADKGDGRLRIGMVPYNSMANVGRILLAKDPSWISDYTLLSSRSPVFKYNWTETTTTRECNRWGNCQNVTRTEDVAPPAGVTNASSTTQGSWEYLLTASGADTSAKCTARTAPADSRPGNASTPNANLTARIQDKDGKQLFVESSGTRHKYFNYAYEWQNGACWLKRRIVTRNHAEWTAPSSRAFLQYRYEDRLFDVSAVKTGSSVSADIGSNESTGTYSWSGCVMERHTTPFTGNAPSDALDMQLEVKPTDAPSRWTMLFPNLVFPRDVSLGSKPSSTGVRTSTTNRERFSDNPAWGDCPAKAVKLTTRKIADRAAFKTDIDALTPLGGTYHDAGMIWGLRLLSSKSLFKDENETAPNQKPINRHLIFMTDGEVDQRMSILSYQGYEHLDQRVSGSFDTSDTQLKTRHSNRFTQMCAMARSENITIWVIAFATKYDSILSDCATAGKLYVVKDPAELSGAFQDIAGQISRLRLSE